MIFNKKKKLRSGLLFINLGSPKSPDQADVREFLKEFLLDPRVMDIPFVLRNLLVRGIILPFRPSSVSAKYKSIWTEQGSPLLVYGKQHQEGVQELLGDSFYVELAMRYGKPSIQDSLDHLQTAGLDRIIIFPLFPQYSSATTGSVLEKIFEFIHSWSHVPQIVTINSFYSEPEFIRCWVELGKPFLKSKPEHVVFSFHGLPEGHIKKSDPSGTHCLTSPNCCDNISEANRNCYKAQSFQTARLIAAGLKLKVDDFTVCFQSRLGKAKWIEPYTTEILKDLALKGKKNVLVFSPSFVTDCLETLEEIKLTEQEKFISHGGEKLILVPSLNSDKAWIQAVASIVKRSIA